MSTMNGENHFVSNACPEYEVFLEEYLEGALDKNHSRKLQEHLRVCSGCSLALDNAAGASQLLQSVDPVGDQQGAVFDHRRNEPGKIEPGEFTGQ